MEEEAEEEEERKTEASVAECSEQTDASTYLHTLSHTTSIPIHIVQARQGENVQRPALKSGKSLH